MRWSMSRTGNGWDKAVVERVFRSLTGDGLAEHPGAPYATVPAEAIESLERFDHRHRWQSTWGDLSPTAVEAQATVDKEERGPE